MRAGILALLAASGASATLVESLAQVPSGWELASEPASSQKMQLRIAMTQPNQELFEKTLMDISTPGNAKYGKFMKKQELKDMIRPSAKATEAVMSWLKSAGVEEKDITDKGEWINFVVPVEMANTLLDTKFSIYSNKLKSSEKTLRTMGYSVPDDVREHIDMIQPTTRFSEARPEGSTVFDMKAFGPDSLEGVTQSADTAAQLATCGTYVTPACLKSLYNIPNVRLDNETAGYMAFNNFLEEYPRYSDLQKFESRYATYAKGESFTWSSVNGGELDQNYSGDSGEANLDAQYLLSIGYPVPMHAYSTGGRGPIDPDLDQPDPSTAANEPYLDWLNYMMDQSDDELPHTITTSYGEDEQSSPEEYRKNVCNMLGQLGARGVSILFSSGDTGVGSACQTNDGKKTTRFLPIFPAACPYVTAVGGTYSTSPERAVSFSSGGFSDTWARPAYQDAAVSTYLKQLGSKWQGLYNPNGRGFPDVAAQGQNYHVYDKGSDQGISGTSASSPTFAGVVALLNGLRVQEGKPPLGFLNPFIYSSGFKGLTDIVNGGSTGCTGRDIYSGEQTPYVAGASWQAVRGWDPVTGYGTPDFGKLRTLTEDL